MLTIAGCSFLAAACSEPAAPVTDGGITPAPFDGTYSPDVVMDDNFCPHQGRVYADSSYYREDSGQKYIAVNVFTGPYVLDDVAGTLSVGDSLRIDRDLTIQVDRIDIDPEWEDDYCPEEGLTVDGTSFFRNKGKIKISKDYFFVHPARVVFADGTVEAAADADKWVLSKCESGYDDGSTANTFVTYDTCKWAKIRDDCKVVFLFDNADREQCSIYELPDRMRQYAKGEEPYYFLADFAYRSGDDGIAKISILVEK